MEIIRGGQQPLKRMVTGAHPDAVHHAFIILDSPRLSKATLSRPIQASWHLPGLLCIGSNSSAKCLKPHPCLLSSSSIHAKSDTSEQNLTSIIVLFSLTYEPAPFAFPTAASPRQPSCSTLQLHSFSAVPLRSASTAPGCSTRQSSLNQPRRLVGEKLGMSLMTPFFAHFRVPDKNCSQPQRRNPPL